MIKTKDSFLIAVLRLKVTVRLPTVIKNLKTNQVH